MATPERLMGVGMPDELAKRIGFFIENVTDGLPYTSKGPCNRIIVVSAATSSISLDDSHDLGDMVIVVAHAAVSLYAGTTGFIWPTSAGVSHIVTADVSRLFVKTRSTAGIAVWDVITSV